MVFIRLLSHIFLLMSISAGEGRAGAQVRALSFDHLVAIMLLGMVLVKDN